MCYVCFFKWGNLIILIIKIKRKYRLGERLLLIKYAATLAKGQSKKIAYSINTKCIIVLFVMLASRKEEI